MPKRANSAADGVKELILVLRKTQRTMGWIFTGSPPGRLAATTGKTVEGIDWIRLMYLYPINFTDNLIETIAGSSKIVPYLDLPLQHISDAVLKRMQRRVNRSQTIELVEKLRSRIPNVVLRTTFIVGFPGETEAQFDELRQFVKATRFERLGVFTYSLEPGTPSVKLDGHLPEAVMTARRDELMALQQQIAFEYAQSLEGYELDVLIDSAEPDGTHVGRTFANVPEIDACVRVSGESAEVGEFVPVEIVGREGYDLLGVCNN